MIVHQYSSIIGQQLLFSLSAQHDGPCFSRLHSPMQCLLVPISRAAALEICLAYLAGGAAVPSSLLC